MSWVSLRNTIEAELAEADIAEPIKKTSEELKQIGKDLSESSAFNSEKFTFEKTEPDPVTEDEPDPKALKEPDSGKPEDA